MWFALSSNASLVVGVVTVRVITINPIHYATAPMTIASASYVTTSNTISATDMQPRLPP